MSATEKHLKTFATMRKAGEFRMEQIKKGRAKNKAAQVKACQDGLDALDWLLAQSDQIRALPANRLSIDEMFSLDGGR